MEVTHGESLTLENIGLGAGVEKFEQALKQVLENCLDPNTPEKAIREITLKVKIKPLNEARTEAAVTIDCIPKLAPAKTFPTRIFLGKDIRGNVEAHEVNANQYLLFPKTQGNVTSMAAASGGKDDK